MFTFSGHISSIVVCGNLLYFGMSGGGLRAYKIDIKNGNINLLPTYIFEGKPSQILGNLNDKQLIAFD